jgi:oligopeptidase B
MKAGKFTKRKNTFKDFIDCSKFVIEQKIPGKTSICRIVVPVVVSLMGVILNIWRQTISWRGIAQVPL